MARQEKRDIQKQCLFIDELWRRLLIDIDGMDEWLTNRTRAKEDIKRIRKELQDLRKMFDW